MHADTDRAKVYGYTVLVGAGTGSYIVAGFAVTQALVAVEDIPNSVGFQAIGKFSVLFRKGAPIFAWTGLNLLSSTGPQMRCLSRSIRENILQHSSE